MIFLRKKQNWVSRKKKPWKHVGEPGGNILGEPIIEPAAKEAAYWQLDAVRVIFASMPT